MLRLLQQSLRPLLYPSGLSPARQDGSIVMLGELGIGFVELNLILAVLIYTGFKIVALNDFSNAAKVFVGVHMRLCPALLIYGKKASTYE